MLQTKRKKKKNLKRKITVILITLLLLVAVLGYLFYTRKYNKTLFINPLSKNFSFSEESRNEKEISNIRRGLEKVNLIPEKINAENGAYIAEMKDKSVIIFSNSKEINSQIASLQFILTRLTMEGKLFTRLDLRFDKPVIVLRK